MSSPSPLSLDWIIECRPDLLPPVDIEGYRVNGRHEEPWWADAIDMLPAVLPRLSLQRQELVNAIFFQGMSIRAYARHRGIDHASVVRQLQRTMKRLRVLMEEERGAA
jgi:DNA-directed RNA polymerase specialized sigma24 family protein